MARHALPNSPRTHRVAVGLAVVGLLAAGTAVGYAATSSTGVIHGCYRTSTGSLSVHSASYTCPSGSKAISWNKSGPTGPAGQTAAYMGIGHYGRIDGRRLPSGMTKVLEAETPKLPTGVYTVNGSAGVSVSGDNTLECFTAIVSAAPKNDGDNVDIFNSDFPTNNFTSLSIDDYFTHVVTDDRIGLYCFTYGEDEDDYGRVARAEVVATRVHSLAVSKLK